MATKPTKRILDWASGGTATDPGAGVEADGWEPDDRPPAYWWNWILQSFGDWLTWSVTSIDAAEADIDVLETHAASSGIDHESVARVWGKVASNPAASVYGYGIASVTEAGGDLIVTTTLFDSTVSMTPFVTVHGPDAHVSATVQIIGANVIEIHARNVDGSSTTDIDLGAEAHIFSIQILGPQ